MKKYIIECIKCKKKIPINEFEKCCLDHNSLTRTKYFNNKFIVQNENGIWKYKSWLPCNEKINDKLIFGEGPITYKSEKLAK